MSIEFAVFAGAVVLLIAYRNLGSGVISGAGGSITSGIRGTLAWIGGAGKSAGSAVGSMVVMGLLWIAVIVSMKALFPDAFAAWWDHQNIFWVSQFVAILVILFFSVKYTQWAFGAVIAVMLWSALGSTFWPKDLEEKKVQRSSSNIITLTSVEKIELEPGISQVITVPPQFYARFSCTGRVEVKPYGKQEVECNPKPGTATVPGKVKTVLDSQGNESAPIGLKSLEKFPVAVYVSLTPK